MPISDKSPIISYTALEANDTFSYVALDVDFARSYAYLGTRRSGECLKIVDFSDEQNPTIINTIGSATTPSTTGVTCLGIKLFSSNNRLILATESAGRVEVWDVSDPVNPSVITTVSVSQVRTINFIDESAGPDDIQGGYA